MWPWPAARLAASRVDCQAMMVAPAFSVVGRGGSAFAAEALTARLKIWKTSMSPVSITCRPLQHAFVRPCQGTAHPQRPRQQFAGMI
ncbi:hypothetical protein [Streptomyces sp. NPDC001970]